MRRCYAFLAFWGTTGVRSPEGERVHGIAHGDVHHTWRPKQPQSRRNRQDTWTTVTPPLAHRSNSRNHGQGQRTEGHGLRPGDRDDEERVRSPARPRAPSRARRTLRRRALLCYSAARPSPPPGRNRKLTKMECMVNSHLPPPPPPPPVRRPRALVPHDSANAFGQSRPMTARVILCACAAVRPSASRAESP